MIRSIKAMLKRGRERYRVPRWLRDVIPVQAIWKDGIFRVGGKYSMTFSFTDINYQAAGTINYSTRLRTETEFIEGVDENEEIVVTENEEERNYLLIQISHKTAAEMADHYGFTNDQKEKLNELRSRRHPESRRHRRKG